MQRSLSRDAEWAGLFANQSAKYYDLLALRHEYRCPSNVFPEYDWHKSYIPREKAYKHSTLNRMIKIPTNAVLIPPRSAFGGQAIKRTNYFIESDYTRTVEDSGHDIDYVIFRQKRRDNGDSLFF